MTKLDNTAIWQLCRKRKQMKPDQRLVPGDHAIVEIVPKTWRDRASERFAVWLFRGKR